MKRISATLVAAAIVMIAGGSLKAAPLLDLFNTGMADATTTLPDTAVDPHYTLIQVPAGSGYGPQTYVADSSLYPLATNEWLTNSGTSKWISAQANQETFPNETGWGDYVFRTTFDLTGYNPATAQISGFWATDNNGGDILINGQSTGYQLENGFVSLEPFSITTGFLPGLNTLDFLVYNAPFEGPINPMGLRVELSGTADLEGVPEPTMFFVYSVGILTVGGILAMNRRRSAAHA